MACVFRVFYTISDKKYYKDYLTSSENEVRNQLEKELNGQWAWPIEVIDIEARNLERATKVAEILLSMGAFSKDKNLQKIADHSSKVSKVGMNLYDDFSHYFNGEQFDLKSTANKVWQAISSHD